MAAAAARWATLRSSWTATAAQLPRPRPRAALPAIGRTLLSTRATAAEAPARLPRRAAAAAADRALARPARGDHAAAPAAPAVSRVDVDVTAGDPYLATLCSGCGARLQSEHPRLPGYLPPGLSPAGPAGAAAKRGAADAPPLAVFSDEDWQMALANSQDPELQQALAGAPAEPAAAGDLSLAPPALARDAVVAADVRTARETTTVCQRCHSLKHNGRVLPLDIPPSTFRQQLQRLRARPALLVLVVDLFDLPGSVLPQVSQFMAEGSDLVVVGHKVDLLPTDARRERVRQWLARQVRARLPADRAALAAVQLASGVTGEGVDDLLDVIARKRLGRDVHLIGCANVGKSRLINALLDRCGRAYHRAEAPTASCWLTLGAAASRLVSRTSG